MSAVNPDQRYRPITLQNLPKTSVWPRLPADLQEAIRVVSTVLPFRANQYVVDELIDWDRAPRDPMFQLTFPQRDMLDPADYAAVRDLLHNEAPKEELNAKVQEIRLGLNPHPAGQMTHNAAMLDGQPLPGLQHKYEQTVLFFPARGQTCHAYCTYCFRWAQFVNMPEMKFAARETEDLVAYLKAHPEVTDVLITGGDPLIMGTKAFRQYVEPLLEVDSVRHIRIGTKSLAYWPQRFVTDRDADDLLRLFEEVIAADRHLAVMGHYSHPVELEPEIAQEAIRRVRATGAEIRTQAPLIRHVNDAPEVWARMWRESVKLGMIPYYMFVERDTGAKRYFEVPLARAQQIFRQALQEVSGLGRTVRGPSMSALPGKVHVVGTTEIHGEKVFVLQFLQAREPDWVGRPFFARYDPEATWLDDLKPAFGEERFFFEESEVLEPVLA